LGVYARPVNDQARLGDIIGTIRRRLLVNSWADPAEVEPFLPNGLRPHVGPGGGVVVGCCMIEIASARPWPVPAAFGIEIRAAAHRISVESDSGDPTTLAVYVPARNTDSKMAVLAGGRAFPGVHLKSKIVVEAGPDRLSWSVTEESDRGDRLDIAATSSLEGIPDEGSTIAEIVLGTTLGLSPSRSRNRLEAVQMISDHQRATVVELSDLESQFINSFSTAIPAESLLMTDVDVTWRPDSTP
jgi:hypothetical protein